MRRAAIDVVLTDVEGTTSAVAFVTRVLFPYAHERLRPFLREHSGNPEVQRAWSEARRDTGDALATPDDLASLLERWSVEDRKAGPLKVVQGLIWEGGFRSGALRAHVYPDVPPALREWRTRSLRLAVFSSGSVQAQRLFFAHTVAGDLGPLFEAHFDTSVGAKRDPAAYRAIAASLAVTPARVLFVSDTAAELDAARDAGMSVVGVAREGSTDLAGLGAVLPVVDRLDRIDVDHAPPRAAESGTLGAGLVRLVRLCAERGLVRATSGNFSVRLRADAFAITVSGLDKTAVTTADLLAIDLDGRPLEPTTTAPSAETPLHCALYRDADASVGAVAHTHSIAATVLSRQFAAAGEVRIRGYEMVKALGLASHEDEVVLPIVANDQDTTALARAVDARRGRAPGYLIEGHGLTTWGPDLAATARHVEALEFLLQCRLTELSLPPPSPRNDAGSSYCTSSTERKGRGGGA